MNDGKWILWQGNNENVIQLKIQLFSVIHGDKNEQNQKENQKTTKLAYTKIVSK